MVNRSRWLFASSKVKLPTPFYFEGPDGFTIHSPIYQTKAFDLPLGHYRNTLVSGRDALSFFWRVGLPLSVHEDIHMTKFKISESLGKIPTPTESRNELTRHVYEQIETIAKTNDARLVIVILGIDDTPVRAVTELFPPDAILVNAQDALLSRLPVISRETYLKEYVHWRGSPPRLIDHHPNAKTHRIIAETIVSAISQTEQQD